MSELPEPYSSIARAACRWISMRKGGHVFHNGDPATGLFVVESGRIELRRMTEEGFPVIIHTAGPGESFAEASLFSDSYHCDAVALTDSILVRIDSRHLLERFRGDPEFALALSRRFAAQIQDYRRRLELLAVRSAPERVFRGLAEGMLTGTVKSFAAQVGLTHEAVYRALAALVAQKRITKTGRGRYRTLPSKR